MIKHLLNILFLFIVFGGTAQNKKPRLVVGIVVDQMRYDYIYKYWDRFGEKGFKKLVNEGFFCRNTHFNYIPTYTGPGHASIFTGTTPSKHGIVANDWYSREENKEVYCAEDNTVETVGAENESGKMSPHRMLTTTITDELKLVSNFKSKVIAISLKDRGAILPAGHMADGAYWLDGESGNWVSSTFYTEALPAWVVNYNDKNIPSNWLEGKWETMYPIETYRKSLPDDNPYENYFGYYDDKKLEGDPVFPYDLKKLKAENGLGTIKGIPLGNKLVREFGQLAIQEEKLGKDDVPDFLSLSFSSTDYIGHQFGPHSVELEDTYLKLDKEIAFLLDYLDKKLGKENVLVFLTSDHGGANVPAYMKEKKTPAGYFEKGKLKDFLEEKISSEFGGNNWILDVENNNIYLNLETVKNSKYSLKETEDFTAGLLRQQKGISQALTAGDMNRISYIKGLSDLVQNGFYPRRSGNVIFIPEAEWIRYSRKGTTHGSGYNYDTHVPLIWYGWDIPKGEYNREVNITSIAPTLSLILGTAMPSASSHEIIHKLFKK